jgi:hypothetical protein
MATCSKDESKPCFVVSLSSRPLEVMFGVLNMLTLSEHNSNLIVLV